MNITTSVTNTTLKNSDKGLSIDTIDMVVNFIDPDNYFGGQIRLTADEEGISFQTTTEELQDLAVAKAKRLIAAATVAVPTPAVDPDEAPAADE